jgi:uncharacterized protein with HEPN domain
MTGSKNPRLRLFHIRDEIDSAEIAFREISLPAFQDSFMLRRAAERAIQIVSEAAKALPSELREPPPLGTLECYHRHWKHSEARISAR